jgi:hypothetical protein
MKYDAPQLSVLGSFSELTLEFNKCGHASDTFTLQIPQLVGSLNPPVCNP